MFNGTNSLYYLDMYICISFERLLAYFKKFTKKNKMSSSPALSDRTDENCKYDN